MTGNADAPIDERENGVLVLSVSWEGLLGDVQSNQRYVQATLDSGETGSYWAYVPDQFQNGGVELGETSSGA